MTKIICPKLDFEAVGRLAERGCHDAGVGDNAVEPLSDRQQLIRAGANVLQGCEIKFDQFQAAASLRRSVKGRCRGRLRFDKVSNRANDAGAVSDQ